MNKITVYNRTKGIKLAGRVKLCRTFWEKGLGFMFRRSIHPEEALLFVNGRESRLSSGIHMLFVFTPLAVIWLDRDKKVVDKVMARPFRPWYFPARPARYYLEGPVKLLGEVEIGDELEFGGL